VTDPFTSFHATAALRHLAQRRRLTSLLVQLPEPEHVSQERCRPFAAAQAEALTLTAGELGDACGR